MADGARPRVRPAALAALLLLAGAAWACTEDPLTGPAPEEGEQPPAETVELVLSPQEMEAWRDTTFTGFAVPSDAPFLLVADRDSLTSRALVRYRGFPDSISVDDQLRAVDAFSDAVVRVTADTSRVQVPSGPMTLRLFTLARRFDPVEATWTEAADGRPWTTPGGDLDQEVGTFQVDEATEGVLADTMEIPLGALTDSLLTSWRDNAGNPGLALVLEGSGGRVELSGAGLQYDVTPAGQDTTVGLVTGSPLGALTSTFIFDPPNPDPSGGLRVGGLPTSRAYISFRPPGTIDGVQLTGATVNRAEIVLAPLAAPPEAARFEGPVSASAVELAANPFQLGPKTPVGRELGDLRTLDPDTLATGGSVRFGLDSLMVLWASNPDSAGNVEVGFRLDPDAQSVGFWEFGSDTSPQGLRPFMRLIVTPPSDFRVP